MFVYDADDTPLDNVYMVTVYEPAEQPSYRLSLIDAPPDPARQLPDPAGPRRGAGVRRR